MKYAVKHEHDSLSGDYECPLTISEHATLAEAIHALLESGHGYVEHIASGLQRSEVAPGDVIWLDSEGNRHPAPRD